MIENVPALFYHPQWHFTHYNLHHCQMLQIIVCLKQGITREKFDEDTAY